MAVWLGFNLKLGLAVLRCVVDLLVVVRLGLKVVVLLELVFLGLRAALMMCSPDLVVVMWGRWAGLGLRLVVVGLGK